MSEEKKTNEEIEVEETKDVKTEEPTKDNEETKSSAEDVKTDNDVVPYKRFQEVIEEKNKYKNKVKELEDKLANMENPEEIKKQLEEENEQLRKRNKDFLKSSEVKVKAISEGIRKEALDDFIKVIDMEKLEVDENNNVIGVDELLEDAKENKSFYFDEGKSGGKTAGNFNSNQEDGVESEKDWLKKMMNISRN